MADDKNKTAQDRKLIAAKQQHEINYMKTEYGVPKKVTEEVIKEVGHSRAAVYAELRKKDYPVPPKRTK